MNTLFELKIKELKLMKKKYQIFNDILILLENQYPEILGCKYCYQITPQSTQSGFIIENKHLINYYNQYKINCTIPKDIAINCWLCPFCGRLFKELIPNFVGANNLK